MSISASSVNTDIPLDRISSVSQSVTPALNSISKLIALTPYVEVHRTYAAPVVDFLITYGIDEERLSYRGYGESKSTSVTKHAARKNTFLREGQWLTESFINGQPTEDMKEVCHELNRRTEFIVTGTDYVPKIKRRGGN